MSAEEETGAGSQLAEEAAETLASSSGSVTDDSAQTTRSRSWSPEMDDPPTGSRNLGGRCPRCNVSMENRLKTRYDDELTARLVLVGYCYNCTYYAESARVTFDMNEVQL